MKLNITGYPSIEVQDRFLQASGHNPWLQYLLEGTTRIHQLSQFTWCWDQLLRWVAQRSKLHSNFTVQEYFGGSGRVSMMIQELMHPSHHTVVDIDNNCAEHLKTLPYELEVVHDDAFKAKNHKVTFALLDMPTFTMLKLYRDVSTWNLINEVVVRRPVFLELTDVAIMRMGINHNIYGDLCGQTIMTEHDYYMAMAAVFRECYGYDLRFVARFRQYAAMLFMPTASKDTQFTVVDAELDSNSKTFMTVEQ